MKRTCIQCGKEFELSNSEIGFYKKRKLALPKRCKECREKNRQDRPDKPGVKRGAGEAGKNKTQEKTAYVPAEKAVYQAGQNGKAEPKADAGKKEKRFFLSPRLAAAVFCLLAILYYVVTGQLGQPADTQNSTDAQKQTVTSDVKKEETVSEDQSAADVEIVYTFRSEELFESHFEKHGLEMGFATPEDYLEGANLVIADPDVLHKTEKEDGDDVYFLEDTNEFVVVSTDGYIRTYFEPDDGIEYYERQ